MSRFVKATDFLTGELKIQQGTNSSLQETVDKVEKDILQDLLGCALYSLFIGDWDVSNPNANEFSEDRFKDIFNEFCEDSDCGILKSIGIKTMLMHFIYFEFVRKMPFENALAGTRATVQETSERVTPNQIGLFNYYNTGVENYQSIQRFICDNSSDYPEFKGEAKEFTSWL